HPSEGIKVNPDDTDWLYGVDKSKFAIAGEGDVRNEEHESNEEHVDDEMEDNNSSTDSDSLLEEFTPSKVIMKQEHKADVVDSSVPIMAAKSEESLEEIRLANPDPKQSPPSMRFGDDDDPGWKSRLLITGGKFY
ncbi:unnamed protein product, partial [Mesocestoides corti]|uniref:Helicase ARIP4 n=1 Tax=Mesocestoides corti TaxID=53468 RepID=A0A0R3UBB8_MESCO